MAEIKNVPVIRFKGFSDLWDELLLGSISEIKTGPFGSSLHAEDYVSEGEPIITTEHFKQGELPKNKAGVPQVSKADYERLKPYLLKGGDIVFSRVGSIDINAHVRQEHEGWLFSGRVLRVRTKETIDSEYLHHELFTNRVRKNVVSRAVGQTMPSINTEILKDTLVNIPQTKTEQTQIGSYFQHLDKLISLHQTKVNKLTNLKNAMLEKMFPIQGADAPEIRFKGFSGAWEERPIESIFNYVRPDNYIVKSIEYSDEHSTPVLTANKAFILGYTNETRTFNEPSIIFDDFTLDFKYVDFPYMVKSSALKILTIKDIQRDNLIFALNLLNSTKFETMGHARHYISVVQLKNVRVPKIDEQEKIANYFHNLDKTINLHQTELEKLNNLKKACLEKMFV